MKKGDFKWTDSSKSKIEFVEDPNGRFNIVDILPQYKTCHGSDGNGKMYIGGIDPINKSDRTLSFGFALAQLNENTNKQVALYKSTVKEMICPYDVLKLWGIDSDTKNIK